ncbi:MAG: glycosyltransferase, partial [Terriglobia bacterium]
VLAHATFDPGDSMPTNILEAAAVGVPAVATRWAGIPEIVRDGETGLLVPPRDVNAIRYALLRVLGDRGFASQLGENARTFVTSHFSMKTVAQTFIRHLNDSSLTPRAISAAPGGRR